MDEKKIIHAKRVSELINQYLITRSPQAAKELEKLYDATLSYSDQYEDFCSVVATHAHMLALYHIEDDYSPVASLGYSVKSDMYYEKYAKMQISRGESIAGFQTWIDQIKLIQAYGYYQIDAFEMAVKLLLDTTSSCAMGLAGSAMVRIAVAQNADMAYPAFTLLNKMNENLQPPSWIFEEDIYRMAYGNLCMFYTHGIKIAGDNRIPYDICKALEVLYKIKPLLKDPQQKQWIEEDIQSCKAKL